MSAISDKTMSLSYQTAPRLDRVHIGLVQLSTDHTLEMDWAKLVGQQACVFSTRIAYSGEMYPESLSTLANNIAEGSERIANGLSMDVMAFGCTSASMVLGDDKVSKLLCRHRNIIPATNPWMATLAALKSLNVKRVAVLSPYPPEVNQHLLDQLQTRGFDCAAFGSFGISNDTNVTNVSAQSILSALDQLLPGSGAEAIFMSCTNLRILDSVQPIEQRFGIPALCSNSVLFWHALQLCGYQAHCNGYGQLLKGK